MRSIDTIGMQKTSLQKCNNITQTLPLPPRRLSTRLRKMIPPSPSPTARRMAALEMALVHCRSGKYDNYYSNMNPGFVDYGWKVTLVCVQSSAPYSTNPFCLFEGHHSYATCEFFVSRRNPNPQLNTACREGSCPQEISAIICSSNARWQFSAPTSAIGWRARERTPIHLRISQVVSCCLCYVVVCCQHLLQSLKSTSLTLGK